MTRSSLRPPALASLAALMAGLPLVGLAQSTLYWGGGTADLTDGTALPTSLAGNTGTWSDSTSNWSSAFAPTDYQTWSSGAVANLGYYADATTSSALISVSGNKTLSGIVASLTPATGSSRYYQFDSATAGTTITLAGDSARFLVGATTNTSGVRFNSANLVLGASTTTLLKDGAGLFSLNAGNHDAFTGKVDIRSGSFNVGSSASLAGVTQFNLAGYRQSVTSGNANGNEAFTAPTLTLTLPNTAGTQTRFNDSAAITLAGRGQLNLRGGTNNPTETIGGIALQSGTGIIDLNDGGANRGTWNVGALTRGANATGVVIATSGDVLAHNIRLTSTAGLPTDTLLPWLSTHRGEWLMIDSANGNQLTRVASTAAATDLSTWHTAYDGSQNLRVTSALSGTVGGNIAVNSLGFNGVATNLDLQGRTLTLNSGALAATAGNAVTINNGTVTTSGGKALYVNSGWSTALGALTLDAVLTGTMDVYFTGQQTVNLGPATAAAGTPNTYTGTVYVNSGTLNVRKDAAITGDVVVASGGGLVVSRNAALANTSNITLGRGALLNTGGGTPAFGGVVTLNGAQWLIENNLTGTSLTKAGTGLAFNGGTISHNSSATGALNLLTNVSYAASSDSQAVFQRLNTAAFPINLNAGANAGNAERVFNIANSGTLAADKAEMLVETPLTNGGTGTTTGALRKTGDGTLMLTAANTYTGGTVVDAGTLRLGRVTAAAQTGLTGTFSNGSITEAQTLQFAAPITGTMAVGQTVTGTNIASGRQIVAILDEYRVLLGGTVGTAASQAQTNIALGAVDRIGSLAGNVAVNSGGRFLMDNGTSVAGAVTVNSGGIFDADGSVSVGSLSFASGAKLVFDATASFNLTGSVTLDNSFGVSSLVNADGSSVSWSTISDGTYTLIGTSSTFDNIQNFGVGQAAIFGTKQVYFQNGSLQLVVSTIPEPSAFAALAGFGALGFAALRRRRRA